MMLPVMTRALAARIEHVGTQYFFERLTALRACDNNAYGVEIRQFGKATAFLVRNVRTSPYNIVAGIHHTTGDILDTIAEWYRENRCHYDLHVLPSCSTSVLSALTKRGCHQTGFYTALYGVPREDFPAGPVSVHLLSPEESPAFAQVYAEGFGVSGVQKLFYQEGISALSGHPCARFYGAYVEGVLAGIALLFLIDGIGYLATAATLPAFRGRGCQTALLQQRIGDAARQGCELVVGHTRFASPSQRNMERAGLQVAYTKAIWRGK